MLSLKLVTILHLFTLTSAYSKSILSLESKNFDKITKNFEYSLVLFVGQEQDSKYLILETLAEELANENNIIVASVTIPGCGQRRNHDLAMRFQLEQGQLPELILFAKSSLPGKKDQLLETRYGSDFNLEQLRKFVKVTYEVYTSISKSFSMSCNFKRLKRAFGFN